MIEKLTCYMCPICGAIYNKEKDAIDCEKYHQIGKIDGWEFHSLREYPDLIYVKFKNGTTRRYSYVPEKNGNNL